MKIKLHIEVFQFEFIEIELEGKDYAELAEKVREAHKAFYKVCDRPEPKKPLNPIFSNKRDLKAKSMDSVINDIQGNYDEDIITQG